MSEPGPVATVASLPPSPPGRQGWPWTETGTDLPAGRPDGGAWPRVTIVTPSFNQAAFLEEAIRSVLLQGYPNLEYVVMDGGSKDGSVAIIAKYAPWLTHWESSRDKGQADAINRAFRDATGTILAWLNSDDAYRPGAIGAAVSALQTTPEASLVHGNCLYVDATGAPLRASFGRIDPNPDINRLLERGGVLRQPTVFMRHEALHAAGYVDASLHYCMDYELWLRLRAHGPFRFLPEPPLAAFRIQKDAKTFALPLGLIGEMYQVARRHGGDGLSPALHPLRLRWGSLLAGGDPAPVLADLSSSTVAAWPKALRGASHSLAAQLLVDTGFRLAPNDKRAASRLLRAAARYRPATLLNRGVWSILWRGRGRIGVPNE